MSYLREQTWSGMYVVSVRWTWWTRERTFARNGGVVTRKIVCAAPCKKKKSQAQKASATRELLMNLVFADQLESLRYTLCVSIHVTVCRWSFSVFDFLFSSRPTCAFLRLMTPPFQVNTHFAVVHQAQRTFWTYYTDFLCSHESSISSDIVSNRTSWHALRRRIHVPVNAYTQDGFVFVNCVYLCDRLERAHDRKPINENSKSCTSLDKLHLSIFITTKQMNVFG